MKRLVNFSLVLIAGLLGLPGAFAQPNPTDLPPAPLSLPATTEPQSAVYSRDAGQAMALHMASTNLAVRQAVAEIRSLAKQMAGLQADAYNKDPLLLTCDRYIEKAHAWVMEKHHAELEAQAQYFGGSTNQNELAERRRSENDLSHLMDLILLKELGGNADFVPLIKSVFDNLERLRTANTNSVTDPERRYYRYWQCDRLIGYPQTNAPVLTNSFIEIQKEIGKRYPLLTNQVAQIQREQNIPPAAVAGVKYSQLYRLLDGAAEMYLDCRTPPELQKARGDLRQKMAELSSFEK